MAIASTASSGNNPSNDLTIQEANNLVSSYASVFIDGTPAFDDVRITAAGNFEYDINGSTYSVPVECVRHH